MQNDCVLNLPTNTIHANYNVDDVMDQLSYLFDAKPQVTLSPSEEESWAIINILSSTTRFQTAGAGKECIAHIGIH